MLHVKPSKQRKFIRKLYFTVRHQLVATVNLEAASVLTTSEIQSLPFHPTEIRETFCESN